LFQREDVDGFLQGGEVGVGEGFFEAVEEGLEGGGVGFGGVGEEGFRRVEMGIVFVVVEKCGDGFDFWGVVGLGEAVPVDCAFEEEFVCAVIAGVDGKMVGSFF